MTAYERLGVGYRAHRRPDGRIAARIRSALGDEGPVLNVGAGTGSYEPDDLPLVAVEPSVVMLAQRSAGSAPAVRAVAEALPFPDGSFAAGMAIFTVHHWSDPAAGLLELRRVVRG
ncbi:MAG TPA: methyltransferase domain-containing protein, partial [Acidimicrobiales bacterium]|nr:methyltransferase domain-containing protein [Acidimicrobiales bacterium]